jgi:hypothetical protein
MDRARIESELSRLGATCNRVNFAQHIAKIARNEALDDAESICDDIVNKHWNSYKHGNSPERGDPHYQGLSMGADECSEAINGLKK